MKTVVGKCVRGLLLNALLLGVAETALAGAHTWVVNEVFSNASGTIQFVEYREPGGGPGETGLPGLTTSSNTHSFTIGGGPLSPPTSFKFFLLATAAFAALPGAPTPDALIPVGSVPFFATSGDTITYGPYDSLTFGAVPTDGINSLRRNLTTGPNTPTNYAGTTATVNGSAHPSPTLNLWGMALLAAILLMAGTAAVLRSRATAA